MEALSLPNSMCRPVDVRNRDELVAAIREAEAEYGPTDMIFNNAGVAALLILARNHPRIGMR